MSSYEETRVTEDQQVLYELAQYWNSHYRAPTHSELAARCGKHPSFIAAKIKRLHQFGCVTIYPLKITLKGWSYARRCVSEEA